jgi:hypothetical protein
MTNDEPVSKAEVDALLFRIARLEAEARADAERKMIEARRPEYDRAWSAAVTWQRNVRNEPEIRRLQRQLWTSPPRSQPSGSSGSTLGTGRRKSSPLVAR